MENKNQAPQPTTPVPTTSPSPVQPTATPSIQTASVPPKRNFLKLIIFILLVLLLANGSAAYYVWYQTKTIQPTASEITPSAMPVAATSPISDETANWKTYTNNKNGYSIKYPSEYSVSADVYNPDPTDADSIVIQAGEAHFQKPAVRVQIEPIKSENTFKNKPYTSVGQLAQYMYEDVQTSQGVKGTITQELQSTTFLNRPAFTYTYRGSGYEGFVTSAMGYEGTYHITLVANNTTYYLIIYNDEILPNKISSTFQFTDQAQSDTLNWKTYTNTSHGYSMSYPSDWSVVTLDADTGGGPARSDSNMVDIQSKDLLLGNATISVSQLMPSKTATQTESTEKIGNYTFTIWVTKVDNMLSKTYYLKFKNGSYLEILVRPISNDNQAIFENMIKSIRVT